MTDRLVDTAARALWALEYETMTGRDPSEVAPERQPLTNYKLAAQAVLDAVSDRLVEQERQRIEAEVRHEAATADRSRVSDPGWWRSMVLRVVRNDA